MSRDALSVTLRVAVAMWMSSVTGGRETLPRLPNPSRTALACLSLSLRRRHRSAITDVEYLGAGSLIGARHLDERGIGESVVGLRARLLSDRDHRAAHRETNDFLECHHAAVDGGQPCSDAAGLHMLAIIAAEPRTIGLVESKASTTDREMAAFGAQRAGDVFVVLP
jgi:hypothetical protein